MTCIGHLFEKLDIGTDSAALFPPKRTIRPERTASPIRMFLRGRFLATAHQVPTAA